MLPRLSLSALLCFFATALVSAQIPTSAPQPTITHVPSSEVLARALRDNTLTFDGTPFHATLDISEATGNPSYKARVDLLWASAHKYRLTVTSPTFTQSLIVNNGIVEEHDSGDFYPAWLHNFTIALLHPIPRLDDYQHRSTDIEVNSMLTVACVERDDRVNGISDDLTKSRACFSHDSLRLAFAQDLTYFMSYKDFAPFVKKQIARTYSTFAERNTNLTGKLTTLESLPSADETQFAIEHPTPPEQQIQWSLISTSKAESLLQDAPKNIAWPTVREGKLDGYMIVYAVTDRSGNVREVRPFSSDNNAVLDFGATTALKYKFHPFLVNATPQQTEFPLVIHFTTTLGEPIPELDDKQSRKLISGCNVPRTIAAPSIAGQPVIITLDISEQGRFGAIRHMSTTLAVYPFFKFFMSCRYDVYKQNGKPTQYHANITVTAK